LTFELGTEGKFMTKNKSLHQNDQHGQKKVRENSGLEKQQTIQQIK
jgi:hypothetical protein